MCLDADRTTLERLNQEYVDAFMNADVHWCREHLAEDFVCIESDGSVLNKQEFLANTVKGFDVADCKLDMWTCALTAIRHLCKRPVSGLGKMDRWV